MARAADDSSDAGRSRRAAWWGECVQQWDAASRQAHREEIALNPTGVADACALSFFQKFVGSIECANFVVF